MPPEEDARTILLLALRHDLARLQLLAGARLPEELLELQGIAVKARYSPESTPLPAIRGHLLALIRQLRRSLEAQLQKPRNHVAPSSGHSLSARHLRGVRQRVVLLQARYESQS
jgi:hypothetical protein